MDAVGLATLDREMREDCRVIREAFRDACERIGHPGAIGAEACAHHLCRFYNAFEQMGLRVAKAFENHIDDEGGWHTTLLTRLTLEIEGIRPALVPRGLKGPLRELKGFRHVFVHAYDLELDPEKLTLLLKYARQVDEAVENAVARFVASVRQMHGIES